MEFGGPTLSTFLLRKRRSVLEVNTLLSVHYSEGARTVLGSANGIVEEV